MFSGGMLFLVLLFLYFVPWIVALSRKHHSAPAIGLLNFLLGWTVIGWIGSSAPTAERRRPLKRCGSGNWYSGSPQVVQS